MAQHDYVISNQSGSAFRADLNNALAAVASQNSGSSEPSTTYAYMFWADTTNGKLKLRNGANTAWIELGNLADAGLGILSNVPLGTVSAPGIVFAGDSNTGIYSPAADQVAITAGGVQRINVTGFAVLPTVPMRGADGTAANPAYSFSGDTDTGIYRVGANQLGIATNGALQVVVDASGNVGFGTGSPSTYGKVVSVNGAFAVVTDTPAQRRISFWSTANGDSENAYIQVQNDGSTTNTGHILFATKNSSGTLAERVRITSDALLVGTTSYPAIATSGAAFGVGISSSASIDIIANQNSAINLRRDNSDGTIQSFRRGTNVVGAINVTSSATTYSTSSDYRLKENIQPMTGALAKVAALKPCTYKWKVDGSTGEGFIAHELQEVVPQCVTGEKDAVELVEVKDEDGNVIGTEERPVYQGIDTSFLVATLAAAIQELKAEIDAVKSQLH